MKTKQASTDTPETYYEYTNSPLIVAWQYKIYIYTKEPHAKHLQDLLFSADWQAEICVETFTSQMQVSRSIEQAIAH